jgi:hypothetical protein
LVGRAAAAAGVSGGLVLEVALGALGGHGFGNGGDRGRRSGASFGVKGRGFGGEPPDGGLRVHEVLLAAGVVTARRPVVFGAALERHRHSPL